MVRSIYMPRGQRLRRISKIMLPTEGEKNDFVLAETYAIKIGAETWPWTQSYGRCNACMKGLGAAASGRVLFYLRNHVELSRDLQRLQNTVAP